MRIILFLGAKSVTPLYRGNTGDSTSSTSFATAKAIQNTTPRAYSHGRNMTACRAQGQPREPQYSQEVVQFRKKLAMKCLMNNQEDYPQMSRSILGLRKAPDGLFFYCVDSLVCLVVREPIPESVAVLNFGSLCGSETILHMAPPFLVVKAYIFICRRL